MTRNGERRQRWQGAADLPIDGRRRSREEETTGEGTWEVQITKKDVEEIQPLRELREAIELIKEQEKKARGRRKYLLKKQLIEMCQDQYIIKDAYRQPMQSSNIIKSFAHSIFTENITINEKGEPESDGMLSFFDPKHISALLCNYSALKEEA